MGILFQELNWTFYRYRCDNSSFDKTRIGANALAMMIKTEFLDTPETCMVTDYGTNAEIALKVDDRIYTGSAATGSAIEGQQISNGMLATPGAIADLRLSGGWLTLSLMRNSGL